jgi:hypothetical protein
MVKKVADELESIVERTAPRLRPLDEAAVTHRPTPDRWTIKEVIGHLIDSASNNHQRFVRAQFAGELVFPAYEQTEWVACQHYNEASWTELVDLWRRYNLHLAHVIRHVPAERLAVPCNIGDYDPVTLRFLIEDYVVHLKHHLTKIGERLGWQITETRPRE